MMQLLLLVGRLVDDVHGVAVVVVLVAVVAIAVVASAGAVLLGCPCW